MAIVRATCPTCGDVELDIANVQVQLCVSTNASTYSFLCPTCRLIVNKEATDIIVESLTKAGVAGRRLVVARRVERTQDRTADLPRRSPRVPSGPRARRLAAGTGGAGRPLRRPTIANVARPVAWCR